MWDLPNNMPGALEVTTRSIANQQPKFPLPGFRVSRSPYNYNILADLVSRVTGAPFENYIKKDVFQPLAMRSSSFDQPKESVMPFSVNNWLDYTTVQDTLYPYNRENGGSNGLHSSAADIASWMYMLLSEVKTDKTTFVTQDVFKNFFSPQYRTGRQASIGFGWDISHAEGEDVYTKDSKISSFSSQVTLLPETKSGVAVFSNIGNTPTSEITRNLLLWLKGGKLPLLKIPVSIAMGRKLAATHSLDSAFNLYADLKHKNLRQYDLSKAAVNSFGTVLLQHFQDKEKAIAGFQFCTQQFPLSAKVISILQKPTPPKEISPVPEQR
jgi:CubicO group peptidase (beta-lactamase class C family)